MVIMMMGQNGLLGVVAQIVFAAENERSFRAAVVCCYLWGIYARQILAFSLLTAYLKKMIRRWIYN